jgi:hypothetical protein
VIAGTGASGFSGDGGFSLDAQLSYPSWLALGKSGEIYFSDDANWRIRKVTHVAATAPIQTASLAGDVNGDSHVDVQDVSLLLRIYLGLHEGASSEIAAGDNRPKPGSGGRPYGDGRIGADDLNWLLRRSVGLAGAP